MVHIAVVELNSCIKLQQPELCQDEESLSTLSNKYYNKLKYHSHKIIIACHREITRLIQEWYSRFKLSQVITQTEIIVFRNE